METVLIYTDLLVDDLCALEILGKWRFGKEHKAFIVATNLDRLRDSKCYGRSERVINIKDAKAYFDMWFENGYTVVGEDNQKRPNDKDINCIIVLGSCSALFDDMVGHPWMHGAPKIVVGAEVGNLSARTQKERYRYEWILTCPNVSIAVADSMMRGDCSYSGLGRLKPVFFNECIGLLEEKFNSNKSAKMLTAYNGTLTDACWWGAGVSDNTMNELVF